MPISIWIPLGLITFSAGVILFFATRHKRTAKLMMGAGVTIALLTFILILLAVNSQM